MNCPEMNRSHFSIKKIDLLLSVLGMIALARNVSGALSVDEQVKMLSERYRQV
jgi:hypothetical protein